MNSYFDLWDLVSLIFSRATTNVLFSGWYTFTADFYSIFHLINPILGPLLSCIMFSLFYFILFFSPLRHSMNHQPTHAGPRNVIILPRCMFKAFIYLNLNKVSNILGSVCFRTWKEIIFEWLIPSTGSHTAYPSLRRCHLCGNEHLHSVFTLFTEK